MKNTNINIIKTDAYNTMCQSGAAGTSNRSRIIYSTKDKEKDPKKQRKLFRHLGLSSVLAIVLLIPCISGCTPSIQIAAKSHAAIIQQEQRINDDLDDVETDMTSWASTQPTTMISSSAIAKDRAKLDQIKKDVAAIKANEAKENAAANKLDAQNAKIKTSFTYKAGTIVDIIIWSVLGIGIAYGVVFIMKWLNPENAAISSIIKVITFGKL